MWSLHVGCRAEPWTLGHSVVSAVEPGRPAAPGGPRQVWAAAQAGLVHRVNKQAASKRETPPKLLLINEWMNGMPRVQG